MPPSERCVVLFGEENRANRRFLPSGRMFCPLRFSVGQRQTLTCMALTLTQEQGLIFRITHRDNVPWILDNGMHARNGAEFDPNYRNIGNLDLIDKRSRRLVGVPPGGTLSDYVPFYFTPYSIMMYNIRTGYGVKQVPNEDIVIFVSSLPHVVAKGLRFVFTNQHAYPPMADYFADLSQLDQIDWPLLQSRDFKHDPDDPGKKER